MVSESHPYLVVLWLGALSEAIAPGSHQAMKGKRPHEIAPEKATESSGGLPADERWRALTRRERWSSARGTPRPDPRRGRWRSPRPAIERPRPPPRGRFADRCPRPLPGSDPPRDAGRFRGSAPDGSPLRDGTPALRIRARRSSPGSSRRAAPTLRRADRVPTTAGSLLPPRCRPDPSPRGRTGEP